MSDSQIAQGVTLSFVVPTRNRRDVLGRLLASIAAQDRDDLETIIVDDASARPVMTALLDEITPPFIRDRVRHVRSDTPVGACAARNMGIAASRGRFVVFLDDDVELVGQDLCSRLIATAETNADCGVIALAELSPDGGWGFNLGPAGEQLEVARFHGCGVLFRRACLDAAGGFFEPLGYYYEEFELSMRVIDAGWRIMFDPDARIVHYRDPRGRDGRGIARLISRNALLTAVARFPLWMLPAAAAVQTGRFAAKSWLKRPRDMFGPAAVLTATLRALSRALSQRRPLSPASLRRYKQLARCPHRWHKTQVAAELSVETVVGIG